MGGHYGSVQVWSEDRQRVVAVAEEIARAKQIKMLVGPALKGWIGVYPENNGQDETVGREFAQRLDGYLIHLLVHDDDIFLYWFFHDGKEIDSYYSRPGYFGDDNLAAEEKLVGNPEVFRPLIGDRISKLPEILNREETPTFAFEQLESFAKALGIPNAVTAYEYLKEGEHEGIKGWRQFKEIPQEQVKQEEEKKQQARNSIKAERKKLQGAGLLLLSDQSSQHAPPGVVSVSDGFVVAWPEYGKEMISFHHYRSPWKTPEPLPVEVPSPIMSMTTDAAAQRVAISARNCVQVWDITDNSWRQVINIPEPDFAIAADISADGKRVAYLSRKELVVTEVESGRRLLACPATGCQRLAFHPSGQWLVVGGLTLGLVSVDEQPHWRDLCIGGRAPGAALAVALGAAQLKDFDIDALEKQQREAMEKALEYIRKADSGSKTPTVSKERLTAMRTQMEKNLAQVKQQWLDLKEGRAPETPPRANELLGQGCLGFSRDGNWLWCGTHKALRVYQWSSVLRTTNTDMPAAMWSHESPGDPQYPQFAWNYAAAEEIDAPAIVFGGSSGCIYRLDLLTGDVRELIKLPGQYVVLQLSMACDGQTLSMATYTVPTVTAHSRPKDAKCLWEVWSYPQLRGSYLWGDGR